MNILLKFLAGVVLVGSIVLFIVIQQKSPIPLNPRFFIIFVPSVVFIAAVLFGLGEILTKLDIVLQSLESPRVSTGAMETSPADRFRVGQSANTVRDEPAS